MENDLLKSNGDNGHFSEEEDSSGDEEIDLERYIDDGDTE